MGRHAGARGLRPAALLLIGLALAVALAAGLRALNERNATRAAFPQASGRLAIAGISASVEIYRDAVGVPHVVAASADDALVGLGFAHAQDRLAQMLWLRRLARGRSAEVLGGEGLPADRLARTLDLAGLAEAELARADRSTRGALAAYARGVNARIARIRSGEVGPPRALQTPAREIEDWRPGDSLAVLKLYAWGLCGPLDVGPVLQDLIESLGGLAARPFFPGGGAGALPAPGELPSQARSAPPQPAWRDPLRRAAGLEGRGIGSSAWAVAGARSRSGRPLLAADAHFEPTLPPLLHLDHVRGGDLDVAGATLPGVPAWWTGANRRVAWASTHAGAAVSDLYVETLHASDPELYHDGAGWRPLALREETIAVRGAASEQLRVRATRHGPLVQDLLGGDREPLALAWAGARIREGSSLGALLAVARAGDAEQLRAALSRHREPPLAVVYADGEGAVGLQLAGWLPQRALRSGLVPVPGRARWYDWQGRIPFEELPRVRLGERPGWLIAADNRFLGGASERIEWMWRNGQRARRIEVMLSQAGSRLDVRRTAQLQGDVGNARAPEIVSLALALAGGLEPLGDEAREVAELLRAWDGQERAESAAAAAFHLLLARLFDALVGRHVDDALLRRYLALPQTDPGQMVFDILRSATDGEAPAGSEPGAVRAAVRASLREAWLGLSYELGASRGKWTWGRLHRLVFRPLVPARPGRASETLGPFEHGGSANTPNAAAYDAADPFAVRTASTFRLAVDTGALDELLVALAPGQSEHPGHPNHSDGLDAWRSARARLLATSQLVFEELGPTRLVLEPRT